MNVKELCSVYIEELKIFITHNIKDHERRTTRIIIESYRKLESMLFAKNAEGLIVTTNSLEQLFHWIRRNARKRSGNVATGSIVTQGSLPQYSRTLLSPNTGG